jgi:hypothetical protein
VYQRYHNHASVQLPNSPHLSFDTKANNWSTYFVTPTNSV